MTNFSHLNNLGEAHMVDVSSKASTSRVAVAESKVLLSDEVLGKVRNQTLAKGDLLATARIAGIQAAKRCDSLIPLCHSLPLDEVKLEFALDEESNCIAITATAEVESKTGVEMEALTAASVAALTIYDMCKAADRGMTITDVMLLRKEGGRSGVWERGPHE